ncbi:MAG: patatin-like phospholipase family protein [Gammaproteobacteria bacterium]|nr:patatin-like phospholipase family protein [Gammaproteobacteria bacterium]
MESIKKSTMEKKNFRILVLDGGGSKGIYTLGILQELELKIGTTLDKHFDLIYGTSTGSIIGALLALGKTVQEIKDLYIKLIPEIMSERNRIGKSRKLKELADEVFGNLDFKAFKTDIGIVSLNYETQNPLIFKSNINQAHGMKQSFLPGFGCTISDAVQASCSAYPVFDTKTVQTDNYGTITAIDGGFIANNATLFALVDADKAFEVLHDTLQVLSIGTGKFVEKPMKGIIKYLKWFKAVRFVERVLSASTNTNVILAKLLYPNIPIVRINNTYNEPQYGTNMVEEDLEKLEKMFQLGRDSYAQQEKEIVSLFGI